MNMTMKNRIAMIVVMCAVLFSACEKKPVEKTMTFEKGTWKEILAKAKKENKLIFLDAYASWCGPCKWMAANVFTDSTVAAFYNTKFINAKINMEKDEGIELAKTYQVRAYPTLLYISGDGEVIHRICGSMPAEEFIRTGEDALNPDKQFVKLVREYRKGNRDGAFLISYLEAMSKAYVNTDTVKDEYFSAQKESDLTNRVNWNLMLEFENNPDGKAFQYLLNNQPAFAALYTKDSVEEKIYTTVFAYHRGKIMSDTTDASYKTAKEKAGALKFGRTAELLAELDMAYFAKKEKWNDYAKTAAVVVEKYKMNNAQSLVMIASVFLKNVTDKAYLQKAESWAKKASELEKNPYVVDVYANLLFTNGKKQDAITQEELAIQLAKEAGRSTEKYEKNLEKFRK